MKKTGYILLAIILVPSLLVGIYLGSWWLREDSTQRQNEIDRQRLNRQESYKSTILDDLIEIQDVPSGPQRQSVVDQICFNASLLNEDSLDSLPRSAQNFIYAECNL